MAMRSKKCAETGEACDFRICGTLDKSRKGVCSKELDAITKLEETKCVDGYIVNMDENLQIYFEYYRVYNGANGPPSPRMACKLPFGQTTTPFPPSQMPSQSIGRDGLPARIPKTSIF
eukprot:1176508-Pyramimonas_sp.AAC.1